MDKDFLQKKYFSLIDLWKHHNDTLLKWPQVVIVASIVLAANIFNGASNTSFLSNPSQWGTFSFEEISTGILLIALGFSVVIMLYIMRRARTVLTLIECELEVLEFDLNYAYTQTNKLNHPSGLSGRTLVWWFMVVVLAIPLTLLGFLIIFGANGLYYWYIPAILCTFGLSHGFLQEYTITSKHKEEMNKRKLTT